MDSKAIDLLIERKPDLKGARSKLERMNSGAFCMHRSWGFGQIQGFDSGEGKLIIDFEDGKKGHRMDPAFCVDKLEILSESNILVRRRQDPSAVEEMVKKRPTDLIVEILAYLPDQSASGSELENIVSRLLGPAKYRKWWTATKKLLVKDPRVATPARKTDPYILRDEPLKPEEEILEEFYSIKNPKKKIQLAEKLYTISDNVKEIEQDLPNIFDNLTQAIKQAHGLTQAERLHGVWVRNDLARHLHADPEQIEPTSKSLILETAEIQELADEIPASYQKRFLDLLTRVYPENWQQVIIDLLRNSEGRLTAECVAFLVDHKCGDLVAKSLHRWLDEQNIKGPVLQWIIKNRHSRKFGKLIHGLITPRLLSAVFYAIDYESLQSTGTRRIQLADVLSDDKELIPEILSEANYEVARDLAQGLLINQGFEELSKKSLLARFIKQFPGIQSLISGEDGIRSEELVVSNHSLEKRKAEYDNLIKVKIPQNKQAIVIAREHGDLRENAEYKMARQDQDTLLARKAQLEADLSRARVTDFTEAENSSVAIGSIVNLEDPDTHEKVEFAILGAWDSEPDQRILSYLTPLGQVLLGKNVGDAVQTEIDGNIEKWVIKDISRWVDSGRTL